VFIGIVINSLEEARAIEQRRAERELLDQETANDEEAHTILVEQHLRAVQEAVRELERELRASRSR
jgi:hypothetical protein